jgi:hypothetical protein
MNTVINGCHERANVSEIVMHADGNFLKAGRIKQSFANTRLIGDHDHWQVQCG